MTTEQVRRDVLDGSDEDLRRLLILSESFAVQARRAFLRAGVGPGWTVIDCGCGPVGALALLAEMVGPAGRVAGVDFSAAAIARAESVMAALGLENVDLFAGDIHEFETTTLGGPFDLAFTRAFLALRPRRRACGSSRRTASSALRIRSWASGSTRAPWRRRESAPWRRASPPRRSMTWPPSSARREPADMNG